MPEIGIIRLDDTPVNGELEKGITSNWAYDHENDPDAHGNDLYPWTIFIDVFHTPKAQTNWNTIQVWTAQPHCGYRHNGGIQNAVITWDVALAKGTWAIELLYVKAADGGIFSIQLDSVEKGAIDSYDTGSTPASLSSVTGIVIPTTAKIELKLKMATKNDSSSSYYGNLTSIRLIRTA